MLLCPRFLSLSSHKEPLFSQLIYKTIYLGYGGLLRDLQSYRELETRTGSLTWMGFGKRQLETSVSVSSQVLLHQSHTLFSDCSQDATFH